MKGIIFDMDGLLLNTELIYTLATQRILTPFNLEFTWPLKSKMMGLHEQKAAEILISETKINMTCEEYLTKRKELHEQMFPDCELMPGVEKLVEHLKKHGIPMAVATSSIRSSFELKTNKHQHIFQKFNVIVCGDEVKNGKPNPEIFTTACKKLGLENADVMVFEDSKFGIQAALEANMYPVWVPHKDDTLDKGLQAKSLVLDSILDFKPEDFGFPPYE